MNDDEFSLSLSTFKFLCLNVHNLALWLPAFILAVLLRIITHYWHHQLAFPLCEPLDPFYLKLLFTLLGRFYSYSYYLLYRRRRCTTQSPDSEGAGMALRHGHVPRALVQVLHVLWYVAPSYWSLLPTQSSFRSRRHKMECNLEYSSNAVCPVSSQIASKTPLPY